MTDGMFLCVHVPEFAAQALLRLRGELKTSAVAVVEGVAPLERVCSVNRRAAAVGVRSGMTRAELDTFDGLTVLRRSGEQERTAKVAVLELAGAFTPRVEDHADRLHGTPGAYVVVLDVSGTERLFGSVERLTRSLLVSLQALGLVARIAVSGNLLTAVVAARALHNERGGAVRIVPRGREAEVLAELPAAVLQLSEAHAETFMAWGLRTVGEFAALGEVDVVVRMGQEGGGLWRLARGQAEHHLVPMEAGLHLEEVVEFDVPVEGMESLMFVLGPMLDQLIARAGNRAMELASVRLEMRLEAHGGGEEGDGGSGCGGEHVREIKPALPVADRILLLKLLHLDLEAHPPGAGVVRLRVTAEAGGRSRVQAGLFCPQMPEPGRLEVTLARIAGLVGEQWVGRARLRDSHAPESFEMERFRLPELADARRAGRGRARQDRLQRQMEELKQGPTHRQARRSVQERAEESTGAQTPGGTPTRAVSCVDMQASVSGRQSETVTNIRISAGDSTATPDGVPAARAANEEIAGPRQRCCGETHRAQNKVLRFTMLRPDALVSEGAEQGQAGRDALERGLPYAGEDVGIVETADRGSAVSMRRMRPPVPIRWKGEEESAFWMQGVLYEVRERYGPWRRSGSWWTGEVWSQEEWDVTVEAGAGVRLLCVLTHNLLQDRWHMEAVYD